MSKEKGCKCCKQIWYEDMLDKKWKLCPNCYEYCKPLIDDLKIKDKKITDLQSQLAEKEKEQNQKAIEQLEKVKEKILSYEEIYYQFLESGAKVPVVCLENFRVRQTIDNQIKQLKEMK